MDLHMDGYSAAVFLFCGYIVGQLTYFLIPSVPVVILAAASAVALAAMVVWHWTQFSVDYRLSTWQEGLRNYASYFLVFLVVLLSYGYYAMTASGVSVTELTQKTQSTGRNLLNRSSRVISSIKDAIVAAPEPEPVERNLFPSFSPAPPTPSQNLFPRMSASNQNVGY